MLPRIWLNKLNGVFVKIKIKNHRNFYEDGKAKKRKKYKISFISAKNEILIIFNFLTNKKPFVQNSRSSGITIDLSVQQ